MKFDSDKHHRRSVRLQGYDYAQAGAYFVTICTQNRECLFGEIVDDEMRLNEAGRMVERWWTEVPRKFPSVEMDQYVVMPNHLHGIVVLYDRPGPECGQPRTGHPHRGAPTLGDIMDWFKTMATNEYICGVKQRGWIPFPGKLWQRNYYEHIIRDEEELHSLRQYIVDNPLQWVLDEENPALS